MPPDRTQDPRRLEPVSWEVEMPERMAVTLGKKADVCPRDAGLYLRYRGGASSGPLIRGSLVHLFAEQLQNHLALNGERSLYAPQPGEDVEQAKREVASMTKEWVEQIADERRLPISERELDDARVMAYHIAIGDDVDPAWVVACETKMVLELEEGAPPLVGKVDRAYLHPDGYLGVDDFKTSFYVPPEEDVQSMVQTPWYAALLLWGRPVVEVPCAHCRGTGVVEQGQDFVSTNVEAAAYLEQQQEGYHLPVRCGECGGRGHTEVLGEPLGLDHVQWARCRQVYPRFLRDGVMASRGGDTLLGRADLRDKLGSAVRALHRVQHGVETRQWPAVSGAHCSECTAIRECPLPRQLNRFAGSVNTREEASEAMEWAQRQKALVAATEKEVKALVKAHDAEFGGELPVGTQVWGWDVRTSRALKKVGSRADWDGLQDAVQRAAFDGEVFDVNDWLRPTTTTTFKPKKEGE